MYRLIPKLVFLIGILGFVVGYIYTNVEVSPKKLFIDVGEIEIKELPRFSANEFENYGGEDRGTIVKDVYFPVGWKSKCIWYHSYYVYKKKDRLVILAIDEVEQGWLVNSIIEILKLRFSESSDD